VIGRTIEESDPIFEPVPTAPPGAPNVVVIVLDDLGFGQLGCFGSDIATPHIDRLAAGGLRYSSFHVTSLCSPTRASLLTGRNHHAVGMGFLTDIPIGFPGYNGRIPLDAPTLPKVLRANGYSAYAVGKWHLAPRWDQSASGPFDRWPLGLGFERFYGFLGGDANQWTPELVSDNGFVEPPARPEDGYHLTEDLADRAIRLVQDQHQATPNRPFFLYFATGAMHAPHHAPREYIDRYAGAFDGGWERWRAEVFERQIAQGVIPEGTTLPERPEWIGDWDALGSDERRVYARMMEAFAGFLSHTDEQIGRLLGYLERTGLLDDTLVVLISDNGASAEGGPVGSLNEHRFTHDRLDDLADTLTHVDDIGGFRAYNHYPWGWAWAGNTPLRLWKRYTWLGGVRTPLIAHWPAGIPASEAGAVRDQFCHAVDLLPTVLDAVGVEPPAVVGGVDQQPIDGASLRPTFGDAGAPSPRQTQYFEMVGSRSIVAGNWKATTDHVGQQLSIERERVPGSHDFAGDRWSLFDMASDFAEAVDVAGEHPELVTELEALWWHEAGRNQVLPLDDSFIGRAVAMEPSPNAPRHRSVFRPGGGGVAEDLMPPLAGGFELTAHLDVPAADGSGACAGVVCALGDWNNGWALYVVDGHPVVAFSLFGGLHRAASPVAIDAGRRLVRLGYQRARDRRHGGGTVYLGVDEARVAALELPHDLPFRWQIGGAGLHVGVDRGFPVCDDYEPPFPFTGAVDRVEIEIPHFAPRRDDADRAAADVAQALRHD
jgi:arylsulfatase